MLYCCYKNELFNCREKICHSKGLLKNIATSCNHLIFSFWLRVKVDFWSVAFCPCEIPFSEQLYCLRELFPISLSQWKLMLPGFCPLPKWATLFLCQPWPASNSSGNCVGGDKAQKIHFYKKNKEWVCITVGSTYCWNKQEGGGGTAELQQLQWFGFNLSLGHSRKKNNNKKKGLFWELLTSSIHCRILNTERLENMRGTL